ncbi:Sec-independent protein translocase subunit TatA [Aeromicrobium phragmitis]|uniref:Sec-independent protein translocase protein TatA n=1 Tax=Aeromicrobium phragmitis TaxID=2478914 RepID=A0A3L8PJZ3_9ACTN|nr:Sec-independent protein translocase subunit TatA [Aeromicrobium phragmitis]RLV55621.1 Sec-independent protein translocase subunit TatA [Aeromicrobium phragmitis]
MFRGIGATEILIILGIVVLLFGGRKLPELARGSGRALRIFKSEVKASQDEDATSIESTPPTDDAPPRTVDASEVTTETPSPGERPGEQR